MNIKSKIAFSIITTLITIFMLLTSLNSLFSFAIFLLLGTVAILRLYMGNSVIVKVLKYILGVAFIALIINNIITLSGRIDSISDIIAMFNISVVDDPLRTGYFWKLLVYLLLAVSCYIPDKFDAARKNLLIISIISYLLGNVEPQIIHPLFFYQDIYVIILNISFFVSFLYLPMLCFYPFNKKN